MGCLRWLPPQPLLPLIYCSEPLCFPDGFVGVAFASGGTVLSPVPFLYFGDPVVTDVEPGIGFRFGGYNVTVTGSGFGTGKMAISFLKGKGGGG